MHAPRVSEFINCLLKGAGLPHVALFQGTQHLATLESLAREGGRQGGRQGGREKKRANQHSNLNNGDGGRGYECAGVHPCVGCTRG